MAARGHAGGDVGRDDAGGALVAMITALAVASVLADTAVRDLLARATRVHVLVNR